MSEAVNETVDSVFYVPDRFQPYANRDQLLNEICERLANGEALVRICESAHLPSRWTVVEWMADDEQVGLRISRARELGEDSIAHDALRIADGLLPATPGAVSDPQRDKLRVDTRMKLLAKFNPKRWGDGLQLRHADADGGKLDTAPLVSELLGLMSAHNGNTSAPAPVSARLVREERVETQQSARPAYRPRVARSDVDDLV